MATTYAHKIATTERLLKEAKNDSLKEKLRKKISRLKADAKGDNMTAKQLANAILRQRSKIKELSRTDFKELVRRLSKKPEYRFLKAYTRGEVIDDMSRKAKPVGWRFKGKGKYDKPTAAQIRRGKADGTVYSESRPKRSDVSQAYKLKNGGKTKSKDEDEQPVVRYYFEDEPYEYGHGGSSPKMKNGGKTDDDEPTIVRGFYDDEPYEYENGGYIEVMGDSFYDGVSAIVNAFKKWKSGPMTKSSDIKPAKEDILQFLGRKLK